MSRLIEFNVGDPKSNQQTASKIDCSITINNVSDKYYRNEEDEVTFTPKTNDGAVVKTRGVEINGIETFEESTTTPIEVKTNVKNNSNDSITVSTNDKGKINFKGKQKSQSRYVVTSRQTVVTSDEIDVNIDFIKKLLKILTDMLINDDKKLLSNVLDQTNKIILTGSDLCELISTLLSTSNVIKPTDVCLTYKDNIINSCFRTKIIPFKDITSIKINNQDFQTVQNEAYNVLTDVYNISLNRVYIN